MPALQATIIVRPFTDDLRSVAAERHGDAPPGEIENGGNLLFLGEDMVQPVGHRVGEEVGKLRLYRLAAA